MQYITRKKRPDIQREQEHWEEVHNNLLTVQRMVAQRSAVASDILQRQTDEPTVTGKEKPGDVSANTNYVFDGVAKKWISTENYLKSTYRLKQYLPDEYIHLPWYEYWTRGGAPFRQIFTNAAKRAGLDPIELFTVAIGEGLASALESMYRRQRKLAWDTTDYSGLDETDIRYNDQISGFDNLGLDLFSDEFNSVKKYLPKDYNAGDEFYSEKRVRDEAYGVETVNTAMFKNLETGIDGLAAVYATRRDKVLDLGKKSGYGEPTRDQLQFWSYYYFKGPVEAEMALKDAKGWDYSFFYTTDHTYTVKPKTGKSKTHKAKIDQSENNHPGENTSKALKRVATTNYIKIKTGSVTNVLQKKSLTISDAHDSNEKEADEVARKVISGESAEIKGSSDSLSPKGDGVSEVPSDFSSRLNSSKGSGASLNESVRTDMESKMGADLSSVKIHTGSAANAMSESINAKAFTHGQDVYFGNGYSPGNKELLAHELVHTVQQSNGKIQPKVQRKVEQPGEIDGFAYVPAHEQDRYVTTNTALYEKADKLSQVILSLKADSDIVVLNASPTWYFAGDKASDLKGYIPRSAVSSESHTQIKERPSYTEIEIRDKPTTDTKTGYTVYYEIDFDISPGDPRKEAYATYLNKVYGIPYAAGLKSTWFWTGDPFKAVTASKEKPAVRSVSVSAETYVTHTFDYVSFQPRDRYLLTKIVQQELPTYDSEDDRGYLQFLTYPLQELAPFTLDELYMEFRQLYDANERKVALGEEQRKGVFSIADEVISGKNQVPAGPEYTKRVSLSSFAKQMLKDALIEEVEIRMLQQSGALAPDLYILGLDIDKERAQNELALELDYMREAYALYYDALLRSMTLCYGDDDVHRELFSIPPWQQYLRFVRDTTYQPSGPFKELEDAYPDIVYNWDAFRFQMGVNADGKNLNRNPPSYASLTPFERSKHKRELDNNELRWITYTSSDEYNTKARDLLHAIDALEKGKEEAYEHLQFDANGQSKAFPLRAVLVGDDGAVLPLNLYALLTEDKEYKIIDLTYLQQGETYTGSEEVTVESDNKQQQVALESAFQEFADECKHPKGTVIINKPEKFYEATDWAPLWKGACDGERWEDTAAETSGVVATLSGLLGLILTFVPLPGARVAAGFFFSVAGLAGAASGGFSLWGRYQHETLDWDGETFMNIVDIVSGAAMGTVGFMKMAKNTLKVGEKTLQTGYIIAEGSDKIADLSFGIMISSQYTQRIDDLKAKLAAGTIDEVKFNEDMRALNKEMLLAGGLLILGNAGNIREKIRMKGEYAKLTKGESAALLHQEARAAQDRIAELNVRIKILKQTPSTAPSASLTAGAGFRTLYQISVNYLQALKAAGEMNFLRFKVYMKKQNLQKSFASDAEFDKTIQEIYDDFTMKGFTAAEKQAVMDYRAKFQGSPHTNRQIADADAIVTQHVTSDKNRAELMIGVGDDTVVLSRGLPHFGEKGMLKVVRMKKIFAVPQPDFNRMIDLSVTYGTPQERVIKFMNNVYDGITASPTTTWENTLDWTERFKSHPSGNSLLPFASGSQTSTVHSHTSVLPDGTSKTFIVSEYDLYHYKKGHTWEGYSMEDRNINRNPISSFFAEGTSDLEIKNYISDVCNDSNFLSSVQAKITAGKHSVQSNVTVDGIEYQITVKLTDMRVVQFFPLSGSTITNVRKEILSGSKHLLNL